MPDLDDDDDFEDEDDEDEEESEEEHTPEKEALIPDPFELQAKCQSFGAPKSWPEWLKKDIVRYINYHSADLNSLSNFLEVHVGSLIIWKRKHGPKKD
jgi:hypothetical protein